MCVGEVKSKGQGELEKDIANLKAAMAEHGAERGFMNAASPGVLAVFIPNIHYATEDEYVGGHNSLRDRWPIVFFPAVFRHIGPNSSCDVIVDGTNCFARYAVLFHDGSRNVD